ncbi:hypothetical protein HNY73_013260 [Argiope bruennichi]|uniref:Uncharacterized protein n=1 Tax=Argiope bruennichi TaxID=94029 RepID=A0A8T0EZN6_ARGBR|nr:hypothetical protein HNY73_013260 [Argiope bruennichi]
MDARHPGMPSDVTDPKIENNRCRTLFGPMSLSSSMGRCVRRSSSMMSPPLSIQLLKSLFLPFSPLFFTPFMGCFPCGCGSFLSQGTQIFLIILGIFMGIFLLYGVYRLYFWCQKDPRRT